MTSYAVNTRTIARDLALLTEPNLYSVEIKVCGGGNRVAKVDLEDFAPPEEVLSVWNSLGGKARSPQIQLFEALTEAVKVLTEERRRIYETLTIHLGIERVVCGTRLVEFQQAFEALQAESEKQLNLVLTEHGRAKAEWLNYEILPLLQAGRFDRGDARSRLAEYAIRFPSYEKIEAKFGVQLRFNPTRSFKDLIERDTALQQQMAERAQAEANWMQAQSQQQQITDEAMAAQRALHLQETRLRSAIEEKVAEVQSQVLEVLRRNLQQVVNREWNTGSMPSGMQEQLQSLAASARMISQADASFGDWSTRINQVRQTGINQDAEVDLQTQVAGLIRDLDSRLQISDVEMLDSAGAIDRAFFVEFGDEYAVA